MHPGIHGPCGEGQTQENMTGPLTDKHGSRPPWRKGGVSLQGQGTTVAVWLYKGRRGRDEGGGGGILDATRPWLCESRRHGSAAKPAAPESHTFADCSSRSIDRPSRCRGKKGSARARPQADGRAPHCMPSPEIKHAGTRTSTASDGASWVLRIRRFRHNFGRSRFQKAGQNLVELGRRPAKIGVHRPKNCGWELECP